MSSIVDLIFWVVGVNILMGDIAVIIVVMIVYVDVQMYLYGSSSFVS